MVSFPSSSHLFKWWSGIRLNSPPPHRFAVKESFLARNQSRRELVLAVSLRSYKRPVEGNRRPVFTLILWIVFSFLAGSVSVTCASFSGPFNSVPVSFGAKIHPQWERCVLDLLCLYRLVRCGRPRRKVMRNLSVIIILREPWLEINNWSPILKKINSSRIEWNLEISIKLDPVASEHIFINLYVIHSGPYIKSEIRFCKSPSDPHVIIKDE